MNPQPSTPNPTSRMPPRASLVVWAASIEPKPCAAVPISGPSTRANPAANVNRCSATGKRISEEMDQRSHVTASATMIAVRASMIAPTAKRTREDATRSVVTATVSMDADTAASLATGVAPLARRFTVTSGEVSIHTARETCAVARATPSSAVMTAITRIVMRSGRAGMTTASGETAMLDSLSNIVVIGKR